MVVKNIEDRVKSLETLAKKQNQRIQVLEDVREIANLMGRYIYKHEVQKDTEFLNTIFANRDDISWEVANFGAYYGRNAVKSILDAHSGIFDKKSKPEDGDLFKAGVMIMHTLTTPVIEVAGDGKTAKGVWISPGHETMKNPETGKYKGHWCWTKYGCDFIREDGKWKMWHYHVYRIFRTPYDVDWAEEYETKKEAAQKTKTAGFTTVKPSFPTTFDNPYTTKYIAQPVPAAPEPFETWDPAKSYGPPGK
jgi:hypothetical protein